MRSCNGKTKTYSYDKLNRRIAETDAMQATTRFEYDAAGHRTRIIDGKNSITSYSYDALGRLLKETYADGSSKQFTYDANGNMTYDKSRNSAVTASTTILTCLNLSQLAVTRSPMITMHQVPSINILPAPLQT